MSHLEHRKTAQELFNDATLVFGPKVTLLEAFPEIQECVVDVEERGAGIDDRESANSRHRNPGKYINCSNPLCYAGGFEIAEQIRDMVLKHQTERNGSALCKGNEGSPKGHRIYRKCTNYFKYKITLSYRSGATPTESNH